MSTTVTVEFILPIDIGPERACRCEMVAVPRAGDEVFINYTLYRVTRVAWEINELLGEGFVNTRVFVDLERIQPLE